MKIIVFLKGDCANISFSYLLNELSRSNHVTLCMEHFDKKAVSFFEGYNFLIIENDGFPKLNDFQIALVPRTPFYLKKYENYFLTYKGIIIADNTTPYEGDDVYGDYVFQCGEMNYENSTRSFPLRSIICGSVKCSVLKKELYKENIILFIESGHYPFGQRGREELAKLIVDVAENYLEYQIIVKPRFLYNELSHFNHVNKDHLYDYIILELKKRKAITNLVLIDKYIPLESLIPIAKIVLHTYSSAFSESIYLDIPTLNISDISSDEVFEFRKNRFRKVKDYIDKANLNSTKNSLIDDLKHVPKCSLIYKQNLIHQSENTISIINDWINIINDLHQRKQIINCKKIEEYDKAKILVESLNLEMIQEERLIAYSKHRIYEIEYLFDDFNSFDDIKDKLKNIINNLNLSSSILKNRILIDSYLEVLIEFKIQEMIKNNYFHSSLDIAALLYFYYKKNDFYKLCKLLYLSEKYEEVYCYFVCRIAEQYHLQYIYMLCDKRLQLYQTHKKYKIYCFD